MSQLDMFPVQHGSGLIEVPGMIVTAMQQGAALAASLSGGKDSHALLKALLHWCTIHGFESQLFAIHANLGRAEWPQTEEFIKQLCQSVNVPLIVVQRPKGDLVARIEERLELTKETATVFWPDAKNRYCTSHLKSGPIDTALRNPAPFWPSSAQRYCTSDLKRNPIDSALRDFEVIISAEGVRADESAARAKKPVVELRAAITAQALRQMEPEQALFERKHGQRVSLNWRPLLHWSKDEVWQACGTSTKELKRRQALYKLGHHAMALDGWPAHPAYVFGNTRLSCALCVLGSKSDLLNGANHNPELYGHYLRLERDGNASFKNGWSLSQLPVSGRAKEIRDQFLNSEL